jgi:hypothetical protein
MPLAAPVITATFPERFMSFLPRFGNPHGPLDFEPRLPNSFGEGYSKGKHMEKLPRLAALLLAAGALAAPMAAPAAPARNSDRAPCFFVSQWTSSSALDDHTILLRVNHRDIYKVGVTGGANELNYPGTFLISKNHGNTICSHLDLQLSTSDTASHIKTPLIARSLVKLTPEEVAQIPKKALPAP